MAKNLQGQRSRVLVVLSLFLLVFLALGSLPVLASQADAANVISSTKKTLSACYNAVRDVEAAEGNITSLVDTLNKASLLLSEAEAAFARNDFDVAFSLGLQSHSSLDNFISNANSLLETARMKASQDYLLNVVGSIAAAFAVVVVGFVAWFYQERIFGRRQIKK